MRASQWLFNQKNVQPMYCEIIELTGVYQVENPLAEASAHARDVSSKGIPSYLKVVR